MLILFIWPGYSKSVSVAIYLGFEFLLKFYTEVLPKTSHDLLALTIHRIEFWEEVLRCVMQDRELDEKILKVYLENRDHLRTAEEKKRQREFAKA